MKTIETTVIDQVIDHAKSPFKESRTVDTIDIGQFARQGDVYLVKIDSIKFLKTTDNRQLAPGSTLGSRHTVDGSVSVFVNPYGAQVERINEAKFRCVGPQIESKDRFTVSHPEHADISLPAGCYQVMFQVDAANQRRVAD